MRDIGREPEREIERDEREERQAQKSSEILDRLDSEKREPDKKERTILETRNLSLKREEKDNNREISTIVNKIDRIAGKEKNPENIKEIIERMQVLDARNEEIRAEKARIEGRMHPEKKEKLDIPKEMERLEKRNDVFLMRAEKNTIYREENGHISFLMDKRDEMRDDHGKAAAAIADLCRYKSITGDKIDSETRSFVAGLHLREEGVKIEKEKLEVIISGKHPEAVRDVYEFGLRVGEERLKPQQMNNFCNLLKETDSRDTRMMELDRMLSGRIPSSPMSREERERFVKNCEKDLEEKQKFRDTFDKAIMRDDLQSDRFQNTSRGAIAIKEETLSVIRDDKWEAKNTIIDMFIAAKENDLRVTEKTKDFLEKIPKEDLKKEDLREIVLKNPEIMPDLMRTGFHLPQGVTMDIPKYEKALEATAGLMQREEEAKLAIFSVTFREEGKAYLLGHHSKEILESTDFTRGNSLAYSAISIVDGLDKGKDEDKKEREDRIERMSIQDALNRISQDRPQESVRLAAYALSECARQDAYAKDVIREIKEKKIDFSQLKDSEKTAPEKYIRDIACSSHPEILVDMNRMGIQIHRGNLVNDERMSGVAAYLKEEAGRKGPATTEKEENLRMAVLQSAFVDRNGGIKNPLNMGSRERNEETREMAIEIARSSRIRDFIQRGKEEERITKDREQDERAALQRTIDVVSGKLPEKTEIREGAIRTIEGESIAHFLEKSFSGRMEARADEKGKLYIEKEKSPEEIRGDILQQAARLYIDKNASLGDIRTLEKANREMFSRDDIKNTEMQMRSAAFNRELKKEKTEMLAVPKDYTDRLYYSRLEKEGRVETALEKAGAEGLTLFDTSLRTQSAMANIMRDNTVTREEKQALAEIYLLKSSALFDEKTNFHGKTFDVEMTRTANEVDIRNTLKAMRGEMTRVKEVENRQEEKNYIRNGAVLLERQEKLQNLLIAIREMDREQNGRISDETNRLMDSIGSLRNDMRNNILPLTNGECYMARGTSEDLKQTDALYRSVEKYFETGEGRAADFKKAASEMIAHERIMADSRERCEKDATTSLIVAMGGIIEQFDRYAGTDNSHHVELGGTSFADYAKITPVIAEELRKHDIGYTLDLIENGKSFRETMEDNHGGLLNVTLNNPFELGILSDEAKLALRAAIPVEGVQVDQCQPQNNAYIMSDQRLVYKDASLSEPRDGSPEKEKSDALKELMREYDRFPLEKDMQPFHHIATDMAQIMRHDVQVLQDRIMNETPPDPQRIADAWVVCKNSMNEHEARIESSYKEGLLTDREKAAADYLLLEQREFYHHSYGDMDGTYKNYLPVEDDFSNGFMQIPEMDIVTDFEMTEADYESYDPDEVWSEERIEEMLSAYENGFMNYVQESALENRDKEVFLYKDSVMYDTFLRDTERYEAMPEVRAYYERVERDTFDTNAFVMNHFGISDVDYTYDFSTETVIAYQIEEDGKKFAIASYDGNDITSLCEALGSYGESFFSIRSMCRNTGEKPPEEILFEKVREQREGRLFILDNKISSQIAALYANSLLELKEEQFMEILSSDFSKLDAGTRADAENLRDGLAMIKSMELEKDTLLKPDLERYEKSVLSPYEEPDLYITQDEIEKWLDFAIQY